MLFSGILTVLARHASSFNVNLCSSVFIGWHCNILRKRPVYYCDFMSLFIPTLALFY